ncbi:MAG TPA: diguanylate cyclase, partial [Chloroflexia bacterium]|nr:diguanylate cyclase [Chloroflexia bacterium]
LQGVGITEAKRVSRLIRRAVAELYPVDGHGQLIPNPTVSQGISSYPHPSPTASDLIEQADAALYQAKRRGRNQLIVYEASGMKEATTTTGHLPAYPGMLKASPNTTPHLGQLKDSKTVTTGHLA